MCVDDRLVEVVQTMAATIPENVMRRWIASTAAPPAVAKAFNDASSRVSAPALIDDVNHCGHSDLVEDTEAVEDMREEYVVREKASRDIVYI